MSSPLRFELGLGHFLDARPLVILCHIDPSVDLVFVLFQTEDYLPADPTVIIAILTKESDSLNNGCTCGILALTTKKSHYNSKYCSVNCTDGIEAIHQSTKISML